MDIVWLILLFGHLFGMALLIGGFAVQARATAKAVNDLMLRGAFAQLVTGFLLVAARAAEGLTLNPPKYAVKLGLAVIVLAIVLIGRRRRKLGEPAFRLFAAGTLVAVAVAVFWR